MAEKRRLESFVTLILEHADGELAQAHRELYPERIPAQIPLSLTLLYPWKPAESIAEADLEGLRAFFAARTSLEFDLTRVAEFPRKVVYAVPEPEAELRAMMRALWALYPECPPYCERGSDPPPHCTLGRLEGDYAVTLEEVAARVEPLIPVTCVVEAATLMVEYDVERFRIRETLPFGR
jgi:2'-5' RNA ligase